MPTYDYRCTVCGHEIEVVHGVHGHGPEACPTCGGPMRKAFVVPAVHFKGSGWAKKDRGASTATKAARAAEGGSKGGDGGSDTSGSDKTGGDREGKTGGDGSGSTAPGDGGASGPKGSSEPRPATSAGADGRS